MSVILSVIIPTVGRKTLRTTLESIRPQLEKYDEVLIVGDAGHPKSMEFYNIISDFSDYRISYRDFQFINEHKHIQSCWGNPQRNYGLELAKGTHIVLIDDDDAFRLNAFADFRTYACDRPVIFKMEYLNHYLLWKHEGLLECGNFGTPCFLVPRVDPMPKFGMHYAGDADYIIDACNMIGDPVWRPEIVAQIRPHESE